MELCDEQRTYFMGQYSATLQPGSECRRGLSARLAELKAMETADGDNDGARWNRVAELLKVRADNAREWRDVCLNYFGQFAHKAPRNANSH